MRTCYLIAALLLPVAASASEKIGSWHHASAPMGQFEGFYKSNDEMLEVSYGCAGSYSDVRFWLKLEDEHSGQSQLLIDGTPVGDFPSEYHSDVQVLIFQTNVKHNSASSKKRFHNTIIEKLSHGKIAHWITPSGQAFKIDLQEATQISLCSIY